MQDEIFKRSFPIKLEAHGESLKMLFHTFQFKSYEME